MTEREAVTIRRAARSADMTIGRFVVKACRVLASAHKQLHRLAKQARSEDEALAAIERAAKRAGGKA